MTEAEKTPAETATATPAAEAPAAKEATTTEKEEPVKGEEAKTENGEEAAAPAAEATKTEEASEKPSTTTPSKPTKPKAPPKDYGPIISTYEDMDVLSGRGAAVNNHPGNKKFRALCFVRKAHFDLGNHAAKRRLATEIVEILQSGKDHPPSRFLKRRPANALPPADASTETPASGSTPLYYAMTKEQAILKAQQVMRDYKRPDRLEAKMLQQQAQQARYLPAAEGATTEEGAATAAAAPIPNNLPKPHRARAVPSTPLEGVVDMLDAPDVEKDELFQANPFGVHAHDVLSGRGAYVNGHVGNGRLRKMALERKAQFDAGNYTEKRQLASEIVTLVKSLDPPGRFLKKASKELLEAHEKAKAEKDKKEEPAEAPKEDSTETKKAEDKKTEETKEEAKEEAPATSEAATQPPANHLPPLIDDVWEELSDEKAIHKACQVMRDISRPDRKYREERKEERQKLKRNNKRRKLNDGGRVSLDTAAKDASAEEGKKEETASEAAAASIKEETSAVAVEDVVDKALLDSSTSAPASEAAQGSSVEV